MSDQTLILGSASPRRRQLLGYLGVPFRIQTADVDEDVITTPDPAENVRLRALLKAEALLDQLPDSSYLLTADTTVAVDGEMLNKPADSDEAYKMLSRLRGRAHQVYTAVVLAKAGQGILTDQVEVTYIWMRPYTDAEIKAYIDTGDPFDKAGAYAIQHAAFSPVERLDGCYSSVVGLPVCQVGSMLLQAGFKIDMGGFNNLDGQLPTGCNCLAEFA